MALETMEVPKGASPIVSGLARYFGSDDFVDFAIICGEHRWNVHRLVLASHSDVLAKACGESFKEGADQTITLSEEQPECIDAMVMFMYKFDYSFQRFDGRQVDPMSFHIAVCIIADKYDIEELHRLAIVKLREATKGHEKTPEFLNAISLAYDAARATSEIRAHMAQLSVNEGLFEGEANSAAFEKTLCTQGHFAVDVAKLMRQAYNEQSLKYNDVKKFKCPNCKQIFHSDFAGKKLTSNLYCGFCGRGCSGQAWMADHQISEENA